MIRKKAIGQYRMNGGATVQRKSESEKSSRLEEYSKVRLVRPVGESSIPEKDIAEAVRSVVKKHEKALV